MWKIWEHSFTPIRWSCSAHTDLIMSEDLREYCVDIWLKNSVSTYWRSTSRSCTLWYRFYIYFFLTLWVKILSSSCSATLVVTSLFYFITTSFISLKLFLILTRYAIFLVFEISPIVFYWKKSRHLCLRALKSKVWKGVFILESSSEYSWMVALKAFSSSALWTYCQAVSMTGIPPLLRASV